MRQGDTQTNGGANRVREREGETRTHRELNGHSGDRQIDTETRFTERETNRETCRQPHRQMMNNSLSNWH